MLFLEVCKYENIIFKYVVGTLLYRHTIDVNLAPYSKIHTPKNRNKKSVILYMFMGSIERV